MADNNFRPPPRAKNALDNSKLKLYSPNSKGKMASLAWQLVKNNPRAVVYTNDPEDTADYGKISANMDMLTFYGLMQLITDAAKAPGEYREKIDNKNFTWAGGQRSEKPAVVNSTIVSKDAEGVVCITISAPRRPVIKFQFGENEYHNFVKSDGTPLSKGEGSQRMALGYVALMEKVMAHLAVVEYVEPEQKAGGFGNKGGGGGNFQRGGQGGGNSYGGKPAGKAAEDSMDDIESW